jgi:hypothetical protein
MTEVALLAAEEEAGRVDVRLDDTEEDAMAAEEEREEEAMVAEGERGDDTDVCKAEDWEADDGAEEVEASTEEEAPAA